MPTEAQPELHPDGKYAGERVTVFPLAPDDSVPAEPVAETEQALCSAWRSDIAPVLSNPSMGEGLWGGWETCYHYCPEGSFAYGLRLKSEPNLGSGDDTALNGVKLRCWNPTTREFAREEAAAESKWGEYLDYAECASWDEPLAGGQMRIEASQGGGDDTSANELIGWCHNPELNNGPLIVPPTHTHWGSLGSLRSCPLGSAVCGVRSKREAPVGDGDDTALNGIQFRCCTFPSE